MLFSASLKLMFVAAVAKTHTATHTGGDWLGRFCSVPGMEALASTLTRETLGTRRASHSEAQSAQKQHRGQELVRLGLLRQNAARRNSPTGGTTRESFPDFMFGS